MVFHIETGKRGEYLAEQFLRRKGFRILSRNWRCGRYEVDIIAENAKTIHFVEVKTRSGIEFGYPEESVTRKKFKNLQSAATSYLRRYNETQKIQFDILSILIEDGKPIEYFYIEDFFLH